MNNFVKTILAIIFIILVGIICFFLGRKVERDIYENQTTVVDETREEDNNPEPNNSLENESFTELTNVID